MVRLSINITNQFDLYQYINSFNGWIVKLVSSYYNDWWKLYKLLPSYPPPPPTTTTTSTATTTPTLLPHSSTPTYYTNKSVLSAWVLFFPRNSQTNKRQTTRVLLGDYFSSAACGSVASYCVNSKQQQLHHHHHHQHHHHQQQHHHYHHQQQQQYQLQAINMTNLLNTHPNTIHTLPLVGRNILLLGGILTSTSRATFPGRVRGKWRRPWTTFPGRVHGMWSGSGARREFGELLPPPLVVHIEGVQYPSITFVDGVYRLVRRIVRECVH